MRVLVADNLSDRARLEMVTLGAEVLVQPSLKGAALSEAIGAFSPDVLVVRSTRVQADQLCASESLSLVIRAGAGVNTIDRAVASDRGIFVANCPGKNAVAVAELTLGLLLAIDRSIPECTSDLREGRWNKGAYSSALGLKGRTIGLLGFGRIGQEVAKRARAFDMLVVAWSRSLTVETAQKHGVILASSPEELARKSDVLSVHLALTPETVGFVGESLLNALGAGGVLLNTSRAPIVQTDALLKSLDAGQLRAGLDVFPDEPSVKSGPFSHPLAQHRRVIGTHHIGASTEEAQSAVASEVVAIVSHYMSQGRVLNAVNAAVQSRASHILVIRHRDRVGVLAAVLDRLKEAGLNVQEMENALFSGGGAAIARIQVFGLPSTTLINELKSASDVFSVNIVSL